MARYVSRYDYMNPEPIREFSAGLERARFDVQSEWISDLESKDEPMAYLMGWYGVPPYPHIDDVVRVEVVERLDNIITLQATIRRGHYALATLMRHHEEITIRKDGLVTCSCHPSKEWWVLPSTIPTYDMDKGYAS